MIRQDRESDRTELLTNIRRLTILVLDDLEEGMRERLLDQAQKRMLSSAGTRLLRLWRTVLRDGESMNAVEELQRISLSLPGKGANSQESNTVPSSAAATSG